MRTISASQIDTYEDCNRFWWFTRILRLPEPPAAHFTFGTVLHGVVERWLGATVTGRVPGAAGAIVAEGQFKGQIAGQPVNLYPQGWKTATEMDGSTAEVTNNEAKLIQRLITEAIERGVLRREPDTQVERELMVPVIEGVRLMGYADVFRQPNDARPIPVLEDHKSYGKGSIRYLKNDRPDSPNYIGANQQLRTYAWATSELDGWDGDVRVRHNQFPKFPAREVSDAEAVIPAAEIAEHGEYIREVAARMVRTAGIKRWEDVPGPRDAGKCARWYGKPCPLANICGRTETVEAYKTRVARLIEKHGEAPRLNLPLPTPRKRNTKSQEATNVSIFDRAKKQQAERAARQESAGSAEAKASVKVAPAINSGPTEPEQVAPAGAAPWSNPKCRACKGRGMTGKGSACPICDNTAKRAGKPNSMSYVVEVDDDGKGIAVAREEAVEALEAAGMPLEWIEAEAAQAAPAVAPKPPPPAAKPASAPKAAAPKAASKPAQDEPAAEGPPAKAGTKLAQARAGRGRKPAQPAAEPAAAETQEVAPEVTPEVEAPPPAARPARAAKLAAEAPNKGGRPTVGLTLLVGAVQLRGVGRPTITSAEVLARFGAELAADMGAESYYDLDTFKRRERLAQKIDYIVGELVRHIVVHAGVLGNDDLGHLVNAIMGASEGVEAIIVRAS